MLGGLQVLGSSALRGSAQRGSWVRLVSPALAARAEDLGERFPVPAALRLVLAREALARGDLAKASRESERLPASADRLALLGGLAEARGDVPGAVRTYLAAGDLADLEEHVRGLLARGDVAPALALQREAVARLRGDRMQIDALAEAYFDLGRVQETKAYAFAIGSQARHENELLSADAYGRAVALAPLDVRYLLSLGNQALNLGDLGSARRTFARARDADPTSADAVIGLGEAALRLGDRRAARGYLTRAAALDPNSENVRRFARELGGS